MKPPIDGSPTLFHLYHHGPKKLTSSLGEKVKLIVDGTILEVANLNRARTQRIKRFSGKAFWGKKKRNLYSEHYKEKVRFEEMYYTLSEKSST